jgi:hypothetical protein
LVSAGAQKNFVAFANEAADLWETSNESINETYFKHLVAKAILYQSLRAETARQPWYQSGYLANIVTYTIAKLADTIAISGKGEFDFDGVWQRQALSDATLLFCLEIAHQVLQVLVSDSRPVANVTEWAKREHCWKVVQAMDITVPSEVVLELVSASAVQSKKRAARSQQRVDDGIQIQAAVLAVPREEWLAIQNFAQQRRLLSPTDAGILAVVTRSNPGVPSERQAIRLMELQKRVSANGYDYERR